MDLAIFSADLIEILINSELKKSNEPGFDPKTDKSKLTNSVEKLIGQIYEWYQSADFSLGELLTFMRARFCQEILRFFEDAERRPVNVDRISLLKRCLQVLSKIG